MDCYIDEFETLRTLVEKGQRIKTMIKMPNDSSSNIYIQPVNDIMIGDSFLQIVFRIDRDTLVVSWLYLLYERVGTGTKVINWFIEYCEYKKLKLLKIVNVQDDKQSMHSLCQKLGFSKHTRDQNYCDYYINIV